MTIPTLWLVLAGMTLAVTAALIGPLLMRGRLRPGREVFDVAVYRDQLKELDAEVDRGVVSASEAESARLEIERRMLRAAGSPSNEDWPESGGDRGRPKYISAGIVAIAVPAFAAVIYGVLGQPNLTQTGTGQENRQAASTQSPPAAQQSGEAGSMASLAQRLEERLRQEPEDADGWELLGRTYMQINQPMEAAAAYKRAAALRPASANLQAALGESIVFVAGGIVPPTAQEAFQAALDAQPGHPVARYYLALAEMQAGNMREAHDQFVALGNDSQPGAPWLAQVQRFVNETAASLGIEPVTVAGNPNAPAAPAPPGAEGAPGPTAEDIEATQDMSAGDRQEMIRGMVERLAARLDEEPDDLNGWLRLGRSYGVLGELQKSREAYEKAVALAPEDATVQRAYAEALSGMAGNGQAPIDDAIRAYQRVLELDSGDLNALYMVGLGKARGGDLDGALVMWEQVRDSLAPGTPDHQSISQQISQLKGEPVAGAAPGAPPGPSADDVAAAQQMAPEERMEMVRGMVARLAERLESQPDDLNGWMRLGNSYGVLGEAEKSREAYGRAADLAPEDLSVQLAYAQSLSVLAEQDQSVKPEAIAAYETVLALDDRNADALYMVGLGKAEAGDVEGALALWQKALDNMNPLSPQFQELTEQMDQLRAGG